MQKRVVEGFQASPQQYRLWSLQQADASSAYRAQSAILISGRLDPQLLKRTLAEVVNRHEILRTCFRSLPGGAALVQVIRDNLPFSITEFDLGGMSRDTQEAESDWLFDELRRKPFDFE